MQNQFDYAIISGGCIGVLIALVLQREQLNTKIILFEGSKTKTASKDTSKIIRTPYIDEEYVSLAKEAKEKQETKLPYYNFYRKTRWIQVVRGDNYKPFFKYPEERSIKVEDLIDIVRSRDLPQLGAREELQLMEDIRVADSALVLEVVAMEAVD